MICFTNQMLESHNEFRAQHKAPPLCLNSGLSRMAQSWAEVLAENDKMSRDSRCAQLGVGENVAVKFRAGKTNISGDVFTDTWYDEIEFFDWNSNEQQRKCGNFTQLVWKSSTQVGFGRAVSDSGRVYVVGRYQPAGNSRGEYSSNVLPSDDYAGTEDSSELQPLSLQTRRGSLGSDDAASQDSESSGCLSAMLLRFRQLSRISERVENSALDIFRTQLLQSHNDYRALHQVPPLRLSAELTGLAQGWAETLAVKDKPGNDPLCVKSLRCGENVATKFRKGFTDFSGDVFSEMWYQEIERHDWCKRRHQLLSAQFTQMVWGSTTEVGFGRAVSSSGRVYVVGRYRPPGNKEHWFLYNVLPPTKLAMRQQMLLESSEASADEKSANDLLLNVQ